MRCKGHAREKQDQNQAARQAFQPVCIPCGRHMARIAVEVNHSCGGPAIPQSTLHAATQRIDSAIKFQVSTRERNKIADLIHADGAPMTRRRKTSPGCSAPMQAIPRPRPRTRFIAPTCPRARPACRSPSICPRRRAMTAITSWRRARSARSACRSAIWATCARSSTQIPLEQMNTSMTINATAPWLLALYIAVAEEQGADISQLQGTVQNDLIKEYLQPRHLYLPAQAVAAADHRCGGLLLYQCAEMEPDERVFLPPARGGRDAGTGTGLRAGHRHRRAGRSEEQGPGRGFPGSLSAAFRSS